MNCKRCNGSGIEPNQKNIGSAMRGIREDDGIGLREMAKYMGVSHGFLSQLESGKRTWSQRLIRLFHQQRVKHANNQH